MRITAMFEIFENRRKIFDCQAENFEEKSEKRKRKRKNANIFFNKSTAEKKIQEGVFFKK